MSINLSNIQLELPELKFPKVTKQAVSKARQGILPSLFKELFEISVDTYYNSIDHRKKWRGLYHIFAVDGSRINLPVSKSNFKNYGEMFSLTNPNRKWSMALGSTIYDVCNDVIVHGLLKRYLGSERAAAMQHCSELEALGLFQDAVIIFDRGYYSEDMFRYFSSKGYLCVMRIWERLKISKKCTGDCILTLPGNKKKGTPATSTSIEQEFYINLLLSNLSALVKCAADQKIETHKKEKNRYRYQANRAYIIGRRKMFIARLGSLQVPAVFPYWTIYLKVRVLTDRRFNPADAIPEKRKQTPATGSTLIIANSFYKYRAPSQLILSNCSSCLNS